jgi:hypothetical protein
MKQQKGPRGCVTPIICGVIGVVVASAFGMRMEYVRGEREWSEIFQWGALSFGLPLGFVLGAVLYAAVCATQFIVSMAQVQSAKLRDRGSKTGGGD